MRMTKPMKMRFIQGRTREKILSVWHEWTAATHKTNARPNTRAKQGSHFCPTFDDALTRHRMLDAIERAAATGQRQTLS